MSYDNTHAAPETMRHTKDNLGIKEDLLMPLFNKNDKISDPYYPFCESCQVKNNKFHAPTMINFDAL